MINDSRQDSELGDSPGERPGCVVNVHSWGSQREIPITNHLDEQRMYVCVNTRNCMTWGTGVFYNQPIGKPQAPGGEMVVR